MEKEKINIRGDLNALNVGEWASFPIEHYEYSLSCRTKLQSTGKKFKSQKQTTAGLVWFQRTA